MSARSNYQATVPEPFFDKPSSSLLLILGFPLTSCTRNRQTRLQEGLCNVGALEVPSSLPADCDTGGLTTALRGFIFAIAIPIPISA